MQNKCPKCGSKNTEFNSNFVELQSLPIESNYKFFWNCKEKNCEHNFN